MAEVQKSTNAGEHAARFIEFVMMQAQNASLFLGLIPHPQGDGPEVNLELARLFIDQLAMIQEKTRGNLSSEEEKVLRNALGNLQMSFVEVSGGRGAPAPIAAEAASPPAASVPGVEEAAPPGQEESRKRFSKSYGE